MLLGEGKGEVTGDKNSYIYLLGEGKGEVTGDKDLYSCREE